MSFYNDVPNGFKPFSFNRHFFFEKPIIDWYRNKRTGVYSLPLIFKRKTPKFGSFDRDVSIQQADQCDTTGTCRRTHFEIIMPIFFVRKQTLLVDETDDRAPILSYSLALIRTLSIVFVIIIIAIIIITIIISNFYFHFF